MALQWLKGTLAGFSEFALAVKKEIVSLQPKDSDTIRWQRDYDGMSAHLNLDAVIGGGCQSLVDDAMSSESAPQYLLVKNTGSVAISKDNPVVIGDKIYGTEAYNGKKPNTAFNSNNFYGVATENIAVNGTGMVAISGFYTMNGFLSGELLPNSLGTWTSTTKGIIRVISHGDTPSTTLVRIIGYSLSEYGGMFKISVNNDNTVTIAGGTTDIGTVPTTNIANPNGYIYLKATYNASTSVYSFSYVSTVSGTDTVWLIGSASSDGTVTQSWQQGAIYFAYRYIV